MTQVHSIELEDGIPCVRFSRRPTYDECRATVDDLADNYPYERRLWDMSVVDFDLTQDEIRAIADHGKLRFLRPNRAAFVAPQDLTFGLLRAFEVYREEEGHATARAFRTRPEALEWLLSGGHST